MRQIEFTLHSQHGDDAGGSGSCLRPGALGPGLVLRGEQLGLGVVKISCADHHIGLVPVKGSIIAEGSCAVGPIGCSFPPTHTLSVPTDHADLGDLGVQHDAHALGLGEFAQRLHHPGEPALRVEHALHQVHPVHQVVDRGGLARIGAEEHGRVAEQLAHHRIAEPLGRVGGQVGREPAHDVRRGAQHARIHHGGRRREGVVEELGHRELHGAIGGGEIRLDRVATADLTGFDQLANLIQAAAHVEVGLALGVDPVAGI